MAVMIRLIDLYHVLGRRLARKLIEAKWIVPIQGGNGSMLAFDAQAVHRALGKLTREGYTLLPPFPPTAAGEERRRNPGSLEEIVLDEEELARLSEE